MNLAILTGNLGRDPELRSVNGDSVLGFSIGVQTGTRDKPATMWVSCSIWGKRATSLQPYLAKGQRVTVSGSIRMEEFKAQDGTPKTQLRMSVDQIDLPPKGDGQAAPAPQQQQAPQPRPTTSTGGSGFDDMDDDIPF
jgi:single-strand DNA-binding protein